MSTSNGHKTIKTADIVYREDLYPRIKQDPALVQKYAEVSFRIAFPDVCPPTLADLMAGTIRDGVFYPNGSVALYYFQLQREQDAASSRKLLQSVYFIRSERGGPVKIGIARDIDSRLMSLQTAHPYPLKVIAVIPSGGKSKERELHQRFAADRLNGEWFEWNAEIEEFVNGIQSLEAGDEA
jgi:hypothetical protein